MLKLLDSGNKIKVLIFFKGREVNFKELGMNIIKKITNDTTEFAFVEQPAKMEGRNLGMLLSPISKKN